MIGFFGNIVFEVSARKTLVLKKFSTQGSAKFADIALINGKARKQFMGAENRSASLDITLRADLGTRPRATITALREMKESGEANFLIIGGEPVSELKFVIKSISEEWGEIMRDGALFSANISLSLEEYK